MKLSVTIEMPQKAFRFGKGNKISAVLYELASLIEDTELYKGPVLDTRGNTVGKWEISR